MRLVSDVLGEMTYPVDRVGKTGEEILKLCNQMAAVLLDPDRILKNFGEDEGFEPDAKSAISGEDPMAQRFLDILKNCPASGRDIDELWELFLSHAANEGQYYERVTTAMQIFKNLLVIHRMLTREYSRKQLPEITELVAEWRDGGGQLLYESWVVDEDRQPFSLN